MLASLSGPAFPPILFLFFFPPNSPTPTYHFPSLPRREQTQRPTGDLNLHETFPKKTKKILSRKMPF
jgi:hypothetical protein